MNQSMNEPFSYDANTASSYRRRNERPPRCSDVELQQLIVPAAKRKLHTVHNSKLETDNFTSISSITGKNVLFKYGN